jgi:hypothetical protein
VSLLVSTLNHFNIFHILTPYTFFIHLRLSLSSIICFRVSCVRRLQVPWTRPRNDGEGKSLLSLPRLKCRQLTHSHCIDLYGGKGSNASSPTQFHNSVTRTTKRFNYRLQKGTNQTLTSEIKFSVPSGIKCFERHRNKRDRIFKIREKH